MLTQLASTSQFVEPLTEQEKWLQKARRTPAGSAALHQWGYAASEVRA